MKNLLRYLLILLLGISSVANAEQDVIERFIVPGTHTLAIPAAAYDIYLTMVGSGGGGGGSPGNVPAGAGGGGEAIIEFPLESLPEFVSGATYTLIVGTGGVGGTAIASAGHGESSSLLTDSGVVLLDAQGGFGGSYSGSFSRGGIGGGIGGGAGGQGQNGGYGSIQSPHSVGGGGGGGYGRGGPSGSYYYNGSRWGGGAGTFPRPTTEYSGSLTYVDFNNPGGPVSGGSTAFGLGGIDANNPPAPNSGAGGGFGGDGADGFAVITYKLP